ncbi:glycosyltransferase family 2 protein [Lachnospiraceae bacterium C1.1]|nr:glycosyltransferase family A protein [Lachnospiraceae bacterium C1.1]
MDEEKRSDSRVAESVSVIIPTYNRKGILAHAVDSVLAQTYKKLELIIVDDGSDDGTEEYVRSISDSRVIYIKGEHRGAGAARNTGVKHSRFNLIAFCDSDSEWHPDKLEIQLEYMKKYPESGLIYCRYQSLNKDGSVRTFFPDDSISEIECSGNYLYQHLLVHNLVGTPTMLIRKEIFERTGGFDESLGILEDYELTLRIASITDIQCCYKILVDDYYSEGSISSNLQEYFKVRCMLIARYSTELHKYGTFNTIVKHVLERAAGLGVLKDVSEMLTDLMRDKINKLD